MDKAMERLYNRHRATYRRMAMVAALAATLSAGAATARADPPALVGVWKFSVHPTDCESGETDDGVAYALNVFYADGNTQEVGFGDDPNLSRTIGVGTWKKVGKRTFAIHTEMGLKDSSGNNFGYILLDRMIRVARDGQTLESQGRGSFYLNDGQLLGSACGEATGERTPEPSTF